MIDLVGAVCDQHRSILELAERAVDRLERWPVGDSATTRALDALVAAESRHELAEAIVLWPVVRDVLPEYDSLRAAAQKQEMEARFDLRRMRRLAATEEAGPFAARVVRGLAYHVALEEGQVLPALADALDLADSYRAARLFRDLYRAGPTRPHPRMPAAPGLLRASAPLVSRADKVRDLLRRR